MLTTALVLALGMVSQNWSTFEPEAKSFRVELPAEPNITSTRALRRAAGPSRLTAAQSTTPDGTYRVEVTENRARVDPDTLDDGIRRFAAASQGTLGAVTK